MDQSSKIAKLEHEVEKLQQKLSDAESIINQLPAHIYWYDKNLRFLGCNNNQAKSANLASPQDIIGTKPADYLPASFAEQINANSEKVLRTEQPLLSEENYLDPSSGKNSVYLSSKAPLYDSQQQLLGVIGTSVEITELKEQQKTIEKEKEQAELTLKHIISILPGHIYWQNQQGTLLGCNLKQAQALGYGGTDEVVGKTVYQLLPKAQADEIALLNQKVMENGITISAEETATFNDGTERVFLSQKSPLRNNDNETIGFIGVSFDITDRKNTEIALEKEKLKAEAANAVKSEFIANISHDIRTPLHAVIGLAEYLQKKDHLPEQDETINALLQSSKTLLRLIEDVMDFSKFEAKYAINNHHFSLQDEINKLIETITPAATQKHLTINHQFDEQIPDIIINDNAILYRILLNFLSNAIKFSEHGSIDIITRCIDKQTSHCKIQISVKDKGIGISADKISLIFERFYRIDPSYQSEHKGTGLGLAIAKQLADMLNGEIDVESALGQGSTFSITFDSALESNNKMLKNKPKKNKKKINIMLVEDDKLAQHYATTILKEMPCELDIAGNGAEAIAKIDTPYDLIFMDIGLPDTNGFEIAKQFKQQQPDCKIVALTAHAKNSSQYGAMLDELDGFLQKPASYDDFSSVISEFL